MDNRVGLHGVLIGFSYALTGFVTYGLSWSDEALEQRLTMLQAAILLHMASSSKSHHPILLPTLADQFADGASHWLCS
jgi:hypothetical protein